MSTSKPIELDQDDKTSLDQTLGRIRRVECFICIMLLLVIVPLLDKVCTSRQPHSTSLTISDIPDVEQALSSIYEKLDMVMSRSDEEVYKCSSMITAMNQRITQVGSEAAKSTKKQAEELKNEIISLMHHIPGSVSNDGHSVTVDKRKLQTGTISQDSQESLGEHDESHDSHDDSSMDDESSIVHFSSNQERICEDLPILAPISAVNGYVYNERVHHMMDIIHTVSPMEALNHYNTPQYKAACWIMHEDKLQVSPNDIFFPERYAFAVFLFATTHEGTRSIPLSACDHELVTCNSDGFITRLELNQRKHSDGFSNFLPTEITHLRYLEHLHLANSHMKGKIPSELGRLNRLETLIIGGNRFTGPLPPEIGRLTSLKKFSLWGSDLEGAIPSEIGLCKNLEHLNLTQNNLQGPIPKELFNCDQLNVLDLYMNELTGTIPTNIHQLQKLEYIRLNENNIHGQIPSEIGLLSSLERLWFGFNQLTGTLPKEIGNASSLTFLVVNDNNLVGTVPNVFESLNKLVVLQFSGNRFTGSVPSSVWSHPSYFALLFRDNQLHGTAPDNFCSNLVYFQADISPWGLDEPKIYCSCCDLGECSLWDIATYISEGTTRPPCPSTNIHNIKFHEEYWVSDITTNVTVHDFHGSNNFYDADICLSPTGCYSMVDDGKTILDDNFMYSRSINFLKKQDDCEAVNICGNLIEAGHPRRDGLNHLTQIAMPNLTKFDDPSSPEYKILCWLINQDEIYEMCEICDGTLLQRYVLAMLYFSQPQIFDFFSFASDHTCKWPGIICDSQNRFVEEIHLPQENLRGTLMSELGLLTRIRKIDLNGNEFIGTIDPYIFLQMPHLQVIDLGDIQIGGTLPNNLMTSPRLKQLNVSNNLFEGTLPNNIEYPKTLESIDLENNMLQGTIPNGILSSPYFEVVSLAENSFEGTIPSTIGYMENLKVIKFNENRLSGSIPIEIFNASQIEILMAQGNKLTGSISTRIGFLQKAEKISLSHNSLKGRIPKVIEHLTKLKILHLHVNRLTDHAPDIASIEDYITDCGNPSFLLASRVKCMSCTICCNSLEMCQLNSELSLPVQTMGYISSVAVPIGVIIVLSLVIAARRQGYLASFSDNSHFPSLYNADSIYCMIYSNNIWAWLMYAATVIIQAMLFYLFLVRSNFGDDETDWQFTMRCSEHDGCEDEKSSSPFGWTMLFIVIISFLGNDIVKSILQLWISIETLNLRIALSGAVLCFLTALAIFTSVIYNKALADSDTELIMNAVVLLFVNEIEESILNICLSFAPYWTAKRFDEIDQFFKATYSAYSTKHIDDDDLNRSSSLHVSPIDNFKGNSEDEGITIGINNLEDRHKNALRMLGMTSE